jgi:hypothetical protein
MRFLLANRQPRASIYLKSSPQAALAAVPLRVAIRLPSLPSVPPQYEILVEIVGVPVRRKDLDALERQGRNETGGLFRVREVAEPVGGFSVSPRKDMVSTFEILWIDGDSGTGQEVLPGNNLLAKSLEPAKLPYREDEQTLLAQMSGEIDEESSSSLVARDVV